MPLTLKFRNQCTFAFFLGKGGDSSKESGVTSLKRLDSALRKGISFSLPELPADITGNVLSVKIELVQHDLGRIHNIIAHTIAGHPGYTILSHIEKNSY